MLKHHLLAIHQDLICQLITFLIPVPASSVKISFSSILLVSEQHSILQQNSPLHYVNRYRETLKGLKVCSLCLQVVSNPAGYFLGRIFPQPEQGQLRWRSASSQTFSNYFFFFWRLLTWLKTKISVSTMLGPPKYALAK